MSEVRARAKRTPPFVAIVGYTLKACFPASRRWGLLLPCSGALLFGLLARTVADTPDEGFARVAALGLFALVLPIGCLVIGDAVLGAEVRGGTLPFTWLSPVPFAVIVVGRWLGGWLVALASVVPACVAAALIAGVPDAVGPVLVGAAAGSAAYVALFVLLGAITRRAAVWSLAVVFLGERLLGAALTGVAQLSPSWEARAAFTGLIDNPFDLGRDGIPDGWGAVVRLAIITVACLAVASRRLRRLRIAGSSD